LFKVIKSLKNCHNILATTDERLVNYDLALRSCLIFSGATRCRSYKVACVGA